MNYKEAISLICAAAMVFGGVIGAFSGAITWEQASPLILAGLAVLGIHPSINTTPTA